MNIVYTYIQIRPFRECFYDIMNTECINFSLPRTASRVGQWQRVSASEDSLHQHTATRTGEGVPLQQISLSAQKGRNCSSFGSNRTPGQSVVPKSAHEAQATNHAPPRRTRRRVERFRATRRLRCSLAFPEPATGAVRSYSI